jgi:hypothetical protein
MGEIAIRQLRGVFIMVATMIARTIATPAFSDPTEFSARTDSQNGLLQRIGFVGHSSLLTIPSV